MLISPTAPRGWVFMEDLILLFSPEIIVFPPNFSCQSPPLLDTHSMQKTQEKSVSEDAVAEEPRARALLSCVVGDVTWVCPCFHNQRRCYLNARPAFFFCNFHKVQLRIEPGRRKLVHRPPSEVSWKLIPVPSTLPSLFLLPFPLPSFGSHALEYYFPCHDCEWILYLGAHTITSKNKSQVIKYCNVQRCHASQ